MLRYRGTVIGHKINISIWTILNTGNWLSTFTVFQAQNIRFFNICHHCIIVESYGGILFRSELTAAIFGWLASWP